MRKMPNAGSSLNINPSSRTNDKEGGSVEEIMHRRSHNNYKGLEN